MPLKKAAQSLVMLPEFSIALVLKNNDNLYRCLLLADLGLTIANGYLHLSPLPLIHHSRTFDMCAEEFSIIDTCVGC
ncbi:hypothetical protein RRG08_023830 [Elysia crispata]|uniref:Uncharacterized protein n=1 Tax=Elysia crispata TaxID=231223 RepID=A0AAE0ZW62_9GAST|nr:hypothetical protein RRG08_023830 [Elysia crispata]